MPVGDDYRVRAVSTWDSRYYDESDNPFTIAGGAVRVHSPNGSVAWQAGSIQTIRWQTVVESAGGGVKLELWNETGKVADLGFGRYPDGEDFSTVVVPDAPGGNDYRVQVISTWDPELYDESDAVFNIVNGDDTGNGTGGDSQPKRSAVDPALWVLYR